MATPSNVVQRINNNIGTGLRNYRNNCFFNATLQALFHVPAIVNCMLENEHNHDDCVTCSLRNTFVQTRQWSRAVFASNLYGLLKTRHQDLLNGEFQDAHNFLLSLLESTEEIEHNNSSITNNFQFRIISTVVCTECRNRFSESANYFSLQIDILGRPCIEDAFNNFFEMENVGKYCDECKKHVNAVKQCKITRAPTILCLQLKRFSIGSKIEDFIDIGCDLIVSKQMLKGIGFDLKYKLLAIICHNGSLNFGHCKTIVCENGSFYEFNDALVKRIPFSNVIRSSEAYVLFYELQNQEDFLSKDELTEEQTDGDDGGCPITGTVEVAPNTECIKAMANPDNDIPITEDLLTKVDDDRNGNSEHLLKDTLNAECNEHMTNDTSERCDWKEVEIIGFDDGDDALNWLNGNVINNTESMASGSDHPTQDLYEHTLNAECNEHLTNDTSERDDWKEVEIICSDDDDDGLDLLNGNIINNIESMASGSDHPTQDLYEVFVQIVEIFNDSRAVVVLK